MNKKERQLMLLKKNNVFNRKEHMSDNSIDHFKKIIRKKFNTCFIFALSEFENGFGSELWGHNSPIENLTSQQKVNRIKWQKIRKNILDKGNLQSRALCMEIDLYDIVFKGYNLYCKETHNEQQD